MDPIALETSFNGHRLFCEAIGDAVTHLLMNHPDFLIAYKTQQVA
jgi:hypothetical protein